MLAFPSPSSSSVRHITIAKSALSPFEVIILCPLITHSSPSLTAVVWSDLGSEPATSGSVIEKHDSISWLIRGISHFFFCSSVPYFTSIF